MYVHTYIYIYIYIYSRRSRRRQPSAARLAAATAPARAPRPSRECLSHHKINNQINILRQNTIMIRSCHNKHIVTKHLNKKKAPRP